LIVSILYEKDFIHGTHIYKGKKLAWSNKGYVSKETVVKKLKTI